ncbi:alcohol oxidase, partial [Aureobasidium melanogenum]
MESILVSSSMILVACLGIATFYLVFLTAYRLYLSPLAKFPGPRLAALTLWYEFYFDVVKHGQFFKEIERMHSPPGPIVRINPFEIHVKDPKWYDELYTNGSRKRDKSAWFVGRSGGKSVFGTIHHDHHRLRRAALNPFFSKRSIAAFEPVIQSTMDQLCVALQGYIMSGQPVELQTAYMALTLDVISQYAFGESLGLVKKPGFSPEWNKMLHATIEAGIMNRHFPWLADLMMSLPPWLAASISGPVAFFLRIQKDVRKQVEDALARKQDPSRSHRTIFEELRDSDLPPQEKTIERLMDEGFILVGAGGETTAQTLAVLTFHLLNNPLVLQKLQHELDTLMPNPEGQVSWQQLEQSSYLRAVVTEAHRVQAVITTRLIRVAPNEVLKFQNWDIPAGTPISMTTHFMHLDPTLFPEPYKFDPERWLGPSIGLDRLEQYVVPFSKGSRACIGLHLASAELYLGVAKVFRKFDLELYETTYRDVEITWDGFAGGFRPDSEGIRVKVAFPLYDNLKTARAQESAYNYVQGPGNATYDYVVVGGGTAGLTVAARLAEDPRVKVAVIEAGDFYEDVNGNLSIVPGYGALVSTPAVDWGFKSTPQKALNGRQLDYSRGKTVGGSSATNLMAYHRGTIDSYHLWAQAVDDSSFEWDNFLPYFQKSVRYTPPNNALRAANASVPNPSVRSYSNAGGPLDVTHSNYADPVSSFAGAAWKELGLAQLKDLTTGSLIGNQYSPATIRASDQTRSTSKSSFLEYAVNSGRNNIFLYKTSLAEKINFANKKATGVQVSSNSQKFTLHAKKEVILAAGTLQTPQILMVSGVGPQETLTQHGIEVIIDLPGVGQNMEDHLFFSMVYKVDVVTLSKTLTDAGFAARVGAEYTKNHSGILTNTGADYFAWEKLPSEYLSRLSSQARTDLAAFPPDWPDYEVVIGDVPFAAGAEYAQAIGMLEAATARGNVSISSASMADPPLIDTQTLATSTDQQVAVQVVKRMRQLWSTKSYSAITSSADEILPGASVQSDEQILEYLLANAGSGFHCACTCKMGNPNDANAVVTTTGKVIGSKNLRIVDASTFPLLPPGHLLATVYALAEKYADDIKSGR